MGIMIRAMIDSVQNARRDFANSRMSCSGMMRPWGGIGRSGLRSFLRTTIDGLMDWASGH